MAKRKLNVAMIGYDFMGRTHSNAWRQVARFFDVPFEPVLKVIVGRTQAKVREARERLGFEEYATSWQEVLARSDIDVIDICTPGDSHAPIAIAAAEAKKAILCEKPLANSLADAEKMLAAVRQAGVVHMLCHNYRRCPAVALAKQIILEGQLGQIHHYRGVYLQDWIVDPAFPRVWRLEKSKAGSGALGDILSHTLDLSRYLVGEPVEVAGLLETFVAERPLPDQPEKRGVVDVDDSAQALVRFASGAVGYYEGTRFATGRKNYNRLEINGSKGSLVWNLERMNELELYTEAGPLSGFRTISVTNGQHPYIAAWWPPGHIIGYEHSFTHTVYDFLLAIAEGTPPSPNFEDGVKNQRVLDAIERSARTGQWARIAAASVALFVTLLASTPAIAEVPIGEAAGWRVSTDGRVNAFLSVARGTGIPDGQSDQPGSGTHDEKDTKDNLRSARIRSGFITSILGVTALKEVNPDFKVTARVGLWMNIAGTRAKNGVARLDPRELYGKIEGRWGSVLGGSDLSLFGRGGILTDARIAHDYGVGYPCGVEDTSGGACGMAAFGAVFPGFDPGFVYTTPSLVGLRLSLGAYDPATIGNGGLDRAPLPRLEAELSYDFEDAVRVFASGFWQTLEGTSPDPNVPGAEIDVQSTGWGAQAGAMLALGPVMLGGAAFQGAGFSPITYLDEHQSAVDSEGTLRKARGVFGLGAFTLEVIRLKIAGGAGVFRLDKTEHDPEPISPTGIAQNPQLLKQNIGATVGLYQTTEPVHFALEYFRAEHTWYDVGEARVDNPNLVDVKRPQQAVNFINAGMTVVW